MRRWRAFLDTRLGPLRVGGEADRQFAAECGALWMFNCGRGHAANLYARTGMPRRHSAWEMQLIIDDGLLFAVYAHCVGFVHGGEDDAIERLVALLTGPDHRRVRARARAYYAEQIVGFVSGGGGPDAVGVRGAWFDRVVIEAYLRLAVSTPGAVVTLDLFPANTGGDNVREGLAGLVRGRWSATGLAGARATWSIRAESYTRYYGYNLARAVSPGDGAPRFAIVVPYANGVRHIATTRCWPIDGAENIARYVGLIQRCAVELGVEAGAGPKARGAAPRVLVSGYSQGGAAVRLFADALAGANVLGREYFRQAIPRGYVPRCRALAALGGGRPVAWPLVVDTVSVATMGGIDGVAFAERFPELGELREDQRGGCGVRSCANRCGGLHLAICHDLDPARWIVPGPLVRGLSRLRRDRRHKLDLVRILLAFAGPAKVLHGGVWVAGARRAFATNPAAQALLDDIDARLISPRFVDEHSYVDPRCRREAFTDLVVGSLGYPGWAVVAAFVEARRALSQRPGGAADDEVLTRAPSWSCDILPPELAYAEAVGPALAFDADLRLRAAAVRSRGVEPALDQELRERARPFRRRHLLDRSV